MSPSAENIVHTMMQGDAFSQWLGIEIITHGDGFCKLRMTIRHDMVNGFGIAHGGISYALADSALAFASNGGGRKSVSIETSIAHIKPLKPSDTIVAEAKQESESDKLGHYSIVIYKEQDIDKKPVALFKGMVFRMEAWTL